MRPHVVHCQNPLRGHHRTPQRELRLDQHRGLGPISNPPHRGPTGLCTYTWGWALPLGSINQHATHHTRTRTSFRLKIEAVSLSFDGAIIKERRDD